MAIHYISNMYYVEFDKPCEIFNWVYYRFYFVI